MRRDAWERSGGFPVGAKAGEDKYMWIKLFLSEPVVHSAAPLSIFHREHSAIAHRKGLVPHHFAHFLGTPAGREDLADPDLTAYLAHNLLGQIVFGRVERDTGAQLQLRRLAAALPCGARLKCLAASLAPLWLLRTSLRLRSAGAQMNAPPVSS